MEITIESANPLKQPSRATSGEGLPSARDLADSLQINVQPQPKDSPVALLGYSEGSWVATLAAQTFGIWSTCSCSARHP